MSFDPVDVPAADIVMSKIKIILKIDFFYRCARSIADEEYIYPLLKIFRGYQFLVLVAFVYVLNYLFFTTQWFIVEYIWGPKTKFHTLMSFVSLLERMKKDISKAKRIN